MSSDRWRADLPASTAPLARPAIPPCGRIPVRPASPAQEVGMNILATDIGGTCSRPLPGGRRQTQRVAGTGS